MCRNNRVSFTYTSVGNNQILSETTESSGYVSIAMNDDSKTRYPCFTAVSNVFIVVELRLMLKEQLRVIIRNGSMLKN